MGTPNAQPAPSGQPYYVWEVPGKVAVRLYFDVIDRVLPEIMRGFGALPRRGAEVGGLLLGRVVQTEPLVVDVEEFEPVPCEYLSGPSYRLSESDRLRLEDTLALWQDRPLRVVGLYRSHTRRDLFVDADDLDLFRRYFAGPDQVFLLVKPFATRTSIAGFFFWENGEMTTEAPYAQFAFHRRELGGAAPEPAVPARRTGEPEASPLPPPRPRSQPIPMPAPGEARRPARMEAFAEDTQDRYEPSAERAETLPAELPLAPAARTFDAAATASASGELTPAVEPASPLRWWWIPAAGVLLLGGAFLGSRYWPEARPPAVSAAPDPLRLTVAISGPRLDITWDREAPPVLAARHGTLIITDGNHREQVRLSAQQLREGRVIYARVTREVDLRLEVTPADDSPPITQTARVLIADARPPAVPAPKRSEPAPHPPPPPAREKAAAEPGPVAPVEPLPGALPALSEANPDPGVSSGDRAPAAAEEETAKREAAKTDAAPIQQSSRAARPSRRSAPRAKSTPLSRPIETAAPAPPAVAPEPETPPATTPREVARPPRRR